MKFLCVILILEIICLYKTRTKVNGESDKNAQKTGLNNKHVQLKHCTDTDVLNLLNYVTNRRV